VLPLERGARRGLVGRAQPRSPAILLLDHPQLERPAQVGPLAPQPRLEEPSSSEPPLVLPDPPQRLLLDDRQGVDRMVGEENAVRCASWPPSPR
jgi:hypothetical protein